jgi:hypothetical protein
MDSVRELAEADKVKAVLTAYRSYQTAVSQDELSKATASAKLPDALVFLNESTKAVIIILPERHDSTDNQVQGGAAAVAKHVLAIPKVKIAVEEPITYNGTLVSNLACDVTKKPQSQALFDFDASTQGSISHQIYVKQVGGKVVATSRYPAEKMPREPRRYNNPNINKTMAENLIVNTTGAGEISVFPVGPDHLRIAYDRVTLRDHLEKAGWKILRSVGGNMTIITRNNNPKNDSQYARHRSIWKGQTDILDSVLTNLKAAPGVRYRRYHGTPKEVRDMWEGDFGKGNPLPSWWKSVDPSNFTGTSGVDTWLGARSPFRDDLEVIWSDFVRIFAKRSHPEKKDKHGKIIEGGTTRELLFLSHTNQHFDLIYSKWGHTKGKHWFFHWTSSVAPQPVNRATIDGASDDEDGESVDGD